MPQYFDPTGTVSGLEICLHKAESRYDSAGLLVLCAADNDFGPETLDPVLQRCNSPIAGGIFPGIIYDGTLYEKGCLVVELPGTVDIRPIRNISAPETDFEDILDSINIDTSTVRTVILFVDGFATRISSFIESLFNIFGLDFNYVGGGAGSLSMERKEYILTNSGMITDGAVLAFLSAESGIGVCHGWQELSGPYQVTVAEKNIIQSIEWQPAFEFYRQLIHDKTGETVTLNDFYRIAQHYPFGIARLSGEQIVRDPYQVNPDGGIVCVGEVQEGTFISLLNGDEKNLIEAAVQSLQRGRQAFPTGKETGMHFFVDCISRAIVLGEQFSKEIDAVQTEGTPLFGVCSIGEIANSGTDYLELYNKTAVMAVLEKK